MNWGDEVSFRWAELMLIALSGALGSDILYHFSHTTQDPLSASFQGQRRFERKIRLFQEVRFFQQTWTLTMWF